MPRNNPLPTKNLRKTHDATTTFTDSNGNRWTVSAEFKSFRGRLNISCLRIEAEELDIPVSRRLLNDLPLDKLFRKELAIEAERLNRVLERHQGSTAHQGREHQDSELRAVADIYIAAYQAHFPVQQSVADALGISVSTAAKRIMAARRRGFIPPNKKEQ